MRGGRLGAWRRVAAAGTGESGVARRRPRPQVNGRYRWRSAAGPGLRAVTSPVLEVRVAPRVDRPRGRTRRGALEVRGRVRAAHPGHPVYLQRRTSGGWRSLARSVVSDTSRFSFTEPADRPGGAEHRVLLPAHPDHATGRSPTFLLRVRPAP